MFIAVFSVAAAKKVKIYDAFSEGVKNALLFTLKLIPCLAAIFMMCRLFEVSTLSERLTKLIAPALQAVGIPGELAKLILIKPFSGSGSLAYLTEIIQGYGADSYIARCACVLYGSSETVFYISAVYFAGLKQKRLLAPILIVLIFTFLTTVLACLICKYI